MSQQTAPTTNQSTSYTQWKFLNRSSTSPSMTSLKSVSTTSFIKGLSSTNTICTACILQHREKKKPLHLAFLDLEKLLTMFCLSFMLTAAAKYHSLTAFLTAFCECWCAPMLSIIAIDVHSRRGYIHAKPTAQCPWALLNIDNVLLTSTARKENCSTVSK